MVRRLKSTRGPRRWREQQLRAQRYSEPWPNEKCTTCGKLIFDKTEDAEAAAEQLYLAFGKPHFVYKHHGCIHLTTHP